jgi:primosomal protein N' (replication factor Y)
VDPLSGVVVLDEHDESYQEERAPTWHARDVALERARRAGVPCVLVSAVPTLEALAAGVLLTASRAEERAGWPVVDVVDRSQDDPVRGGLLSERLGPLLRGERRVVCVLNRTGRSRLSACDRCGRVARCETCQAAVVHTADGSLACLRCATRRPLVCDHCGSTVLRNLRAGVTRVREELEALARRPVVEVTAATAGTSLPDAGVYVGTEAVLHQVDRADVVVFLDLDQELLAPRYRAAEQALGLLARAARLLGGRDRGARGGGEPGRLVLQTRLPNHEVVQAALHADPARVAAAEHERRSLLRFPPAAALASVSGAAAGDYVAALGRPLGVEVLGPDDGHWLVRATDHRTLCDTLAATPRPTGRLRVEVDPLRI